MIDNPRLLEQGSPEWVAFRKKRIGASESACLLGLDPYRTAYELWQQKQGFIPETAMNAAMSRGRDLEPMARASYEKLTNQVMIPTVVVSEDLDFVIASIDGMSLDRKSVVEIKCPGQKVLSMSANGEVPEHYLIQMQHIMYVTNLTSCDYYCFDGENGNLITVARDDKFIQEKLIPAWKSFKECLDFGKPPALTDRDYVDLSHDFSLSAAFENYKLAQDKRKQYEKEEEEAKSIILVLTEGKSCRGNGWKVTRYSTPGRIDYSEIPEIKNIDLERYRKSPTISYRITVEGSENGKT